MELSDDILATHRNLSLTAVQFLEYVRQNPASTHRREYSTPSAPAWLSSFSYPVQSWPLFVGAEKRQELESASSGVLELIKLIPSRLLDGDPKRIADFYGLPELAVGLLIEPPNGLPGAVARCDLIDSPAGVKCIEPNVAANLGGWELRFWAEQRRGDPCFARFCTELGINPAFRDPTRELLRHVVADTGCQAYARQGELNLAVAVPASYAEEIRKTSAVDLGLLYQEVLRDLGEDRRGKLTVTAYPNCDLTLRRGCLYRGGDRIHAIIEFTEPPLSTPPEIYRVFKGERVQVYNGPLPGLLGTKKSLVLLSEHEDSDGFTAAEREVVRRHVAWTRFVREGSTRHRGENVVLLDLLAARREDFVLKPALGSRGDGVLVGRHVTPEAWEQGLRTALSEGGWLAQEHVPSRPYVFQHGEEGAAAHDLVWGVYSFGGSYGGALLRMVPRGTKEGVINSARGAEEGFLYEV
jgi:hypothetical protein